MDNYNQQISTRRLVPDISGTMGVSGLTIGSQEVLKTRRQRIRVTGFGRLDPEISRTMVTPKDCHRLPGKFLKGSMHATYPAY